MPSHPTAQTLARLFGKVLGHASVEQESNFYLMGGHSLAALDLAMAIEKETGLRVGVVDILECPTPTALAERLNAAVKVADVSDRLRHAIDMQLGHEARWLWLERQRTGVLSEAYTVSCLLQGVGQVDPERFAVAVAAAVGRHPALNCLVRETQGAPILVPSQPIDVLEVLQAQEHDITSLAAVVFDPSVGPLLRVRLLLQSHDVWQVLISADHIACDGRGLEILAADIVEAYAWSSSGRQPEGAVPAAGAPGRAVPAHNPAALQYWRDRLTPAPMPLPLPVAETRSGPVGAASASVERDLPSASIDALVRAGHPGLFVPAAAAVARALAEVTGRHDVCLGTAVDRRARTGTEGVVGCLVTTVPLRVQVPDHGDEIALVGAVANATAEAVDHAEVSFDEIVAAVNPPRVPGRTPLFDVWVAVLPMLHAGIGGPDVIALRGSPLPVRTAVFELSFQFVRHAGGLRLTLLYDAARYAADTVGRLADRAVCSFVALADALAEPSGDNHGIGSSHKCPSEKPSTTAQRQASLFAGFNL